MNFSVKYTQTDRWVIGSGANLRAAIEAKIDQIRGIPTGEQEKRELNRVIR